MSAARSQSGLFQIDVSNGLKCCSGCGSRRAAAEFDNDQDADRRQSRIEQRMACCSPRSCPSTRRSWCTRQVMRRARSCAGCFGSAIPHLVVDSTSPLAIKLIVRLVETGTPVVIFPEGRLTITGSFMKVYDGAGFVAARTGATVVPVRIEGAGQQLLRPARGNLPAQAPSSHSHRYPAAPRRIEMPKLPSAKLRRRRAGELMRRILLDMLVATRPQRTLFQAFLDARASLRSRLSVGAKTSGWKKRPTGRCCGWHSLLPAGS